MQRNHYKIDWQEVAWDHGFKGDDEEMLFQWNHVHKLSMEEMGKKIGVCATTVSKRMRLHKIVPAKIVNKPIHGYTTRLPRLPKGD
jgi:hypothetical protein